LLPFLLGWLAKPAQEKAFNKASILARIALFVVENLIIK